MKKLVFTCQVFGLAVMIPVIALLEMNHGDVRPAENNIPSAAILHTAKPKTLLLNNGNIMLSEIITMTPGIFLLKNLLN